MTVHHSSPTARCDTVHRFSGRLGSVGLRSGLKMASAMQQVVVVWEWENSQHRWRPYSPQVVQLLERAFSKGLKSVFLGDAEPLLSNFSVNITTLRQLCDSSGQLAMAGHVSQSALIRMRRCHVFSC